MEEIIQEETEKLYEMIQQYERIVIARHILPDCDAVGSQYGLAEWIRTNWKDKKVYCIGKDSCTQGGFWPKSDAVSEEEISGSLGIVLDTSTGARIDDGRIRKAEKLIKIDHHIIPTADNYGDIRFIHDQAASCTQILTLMLEELKEKHSPEFPQKAAMYLMAGLLTDTLGFSIQETSTDTYRAAMILSGYGADGASLYHAVFDQDVRVFRYKAWIGDHAQMQKTEDGMFAWTIIPKAVWKECSLTESEAGSYVTALAGCSDFGAWAVFTQMEDNTYRASLRSRRKSVNEVAAVYGGGGHAFASGCRNLSRQDVHSCIQMVLDVLNH